MDKFANILISLTFVALATTLVLPGRQTGTIAKNVLGGFADLTTASIGR